VNNNPGIRWARVIAGAFLVEIVLIAITIPIALSIGVEPFIPFVPFACFAVGFVVSWWILRKAASRFLLHGALIGIVATAIYLGLVLSQSGSLAPVLEMYGPFLFYTANAVRIVGCMLGGVAARKRVESLAAVRSMQ
jgi:hypothetical protein